MSEAIQFVRSVYEDIDTMDVRKLLSHLTPEASFVFGNAEPLVGHEAVTNAIGGFMTMIAAMVHEVDESWRVGDTVISRVRVHYTRKDGVKKSYPAAVIWRLRGELIQEFLVYVDNSTLFS